MRRIAWIILCLVPGCAKVVSTPAVEQQRPPVALMPSMSVGQCLAHLFNPSATDADRLRAVRAAWLFNDAELEVAEPALLHQLDRSDAQLQAAVRGALSRKPFAQPHENPIAAVAVRWRALEDGPERLRAMVNSGSTSLLLLARALANAGNPVAGGRETIGMNAKEKPHSLEWCAAVLLDFNSPRLERLEAIEATEWFNQDEARVIYPALLGMANVRWQDVREAAIQARMRIATLWDVRLYYPQLDPLRETSVQWATLHDAGDRIAAMMRSEDPGIRQLAILIVQTWCEDRDGGWQRIGQMPRLPDEVGAEIGWVLVERSKYDSQLARALVRHLELLALARPEFHLILEDTLKRTRAPQAWDAALALHHQAPSGRLMKLAIPTLLWNFGQDTRSRDSKIISMVTKMRPDARQEMLDVALDSVKEGRIELLDLVESLPNDARRKTDRLVKIMLGDQGPRFHLRAAEVLRKISAAEAEVARTLQNLLDDPDPQIREAAAAAIGTPRATEHAMLRTVLENLRNDDRSTRLRGALAYSEMAGKQDAPVAAALVTATRDGDFAVREGIVAAIEKSLQSGRSVTEELKSMAQEKGDQGAFARVAARAVK